jgi:hypothetical protein
MQYSIEPPEGHSGQFSNTCVQRCGSAPKDPDPACHFDADPDPYPACHFDAEADPDPTFHFDPDPDPSFQNKGQNLEKMLK